MKRRPRAFAAGLVVAVALIATPGASAATEFGSTCVAEDVEPNLAIFSLAHPGSPLPVAAPVSGVITSWKLNNGSGAPPELASQRLQVLRPNGVPNQVLVVAESSTVAPLPGANTFPTRLPVQVGDLLGNYGTLLTLYCNTGNPGDVLGYGEAVPAGLVWTYQTDIPFQAPVAAVIEPDADKDGFGDETQDLCPQSAAFQISCPVVTLDAFSHAGGSAVTVLVATSTDAPVKVSGTVKLGKSGKATLGAKAKTVAAGKIVSFKLKFPAKLKEKLKELEPSQKLQLKIVASATNVAGQVSTDKLDAKLKGQG